MVQIRWDQKGKRISVWGDDDFGMEKLDASEQEFTELKRLVVLSQRLLKNRGFTIA